MATLTISFDLLERAEGNCDECEEPLDTDRQTVQMSFEHRYGMRFHQVSAARRSSLVAAQRVFYRE